MTADPRSFLIGLIGDHIAHSGSPLLHESEGRAHGINLIYRLIDFAAAGLGKDDLSSALDWGGHMGFDGFNITHPYKQAVLPLLDDVSPDAQAIGSVNTIVLRDGKRIGHNTDWSGFAEGFASGLPGADLSVVAMIGAGGAGLAVAYAILDMGAPELRIFDKDIARASEAAAHLNILFPDRHIHATQAVEETCAGVSGIIQATPVGMSLHPGLPIPAEVIPHGIWATDLIYTPRMTEFLAAAASRGCRTHNGLAMVICQAARAFLLFTGMKADVEHMKAQVAAHF